MKIVINEAYGLFEMSEDFYKHYNIPCIYKYGIRCPTEKITRKDKRLIEYIEQYGSQKASGGFSRLKLVDIPNGTAYRICEYDGAEYIEYRDKLKWEIAED